MEHGNLEPKNCCLLGRLRIPPKQPFLDVAVSIPQISGKLSCGDARLDEGLCRVCPHPWKEGGMVGQPPVLNQRFYCTYTHLRVSLSMGVRIYLQRGRSACKWTHDVARCDKAKWQIYYKIKLQFTQTKLAKYYKKIGGILNILKTQGYSTRRCNTAQFGCERMRNPAAQYGQSVQKLGC